MSVHCITMSPPLLTEKWTGCVDPRSTSVLSPAPAPLPLPILSAARFHPHSNPDASGSLVGQTPSPEDDSIIRDLLPEDAGIDHQTVHQLIMVLMKFMAKDQSSAEADIGSAKAFNTVKRHLYVLLGYDQQEGCFMIAPQKMRTSTCFNAFIAGISQVTEIYAFYHLDFFAALEFYRHCSVVTLWGIYLYITGMIMNWNSFRWWTTTLAWGNSCSLWWSRCWSTALVLSWDTTSSSRLDALCGPWGHTSGRCGSKPCWSFCTRYSLNWSSPVWFLRLWCHSSSLIQ